MEPISMIVGALVAGAAAKAGDVGGQAVMDAYTALRGIIVDRYKRSAAVAALEEDPSSDIQKRALEEALGKADAAKDPKAVEETLAKAKELTQALETVPKQELARVGVLVDELISINAHFKQVDAPSAGIGVHIKKADLKQDFIVDQVGGNGRKN